MISTKLNTYANRTKHHVYATSQWLAKITPGINLPVAITPNGIQNEGNEGSIFFFMINYRASRGTEPHVALP